MAAAAVISASTRSSSSAFSSRLLGPPESRSLLPSSPKPTANAFLRILDSNFNSPSSSKSEGFHPDGGYSTAYPYQGFGSYGGYYSSGPYHGGYFRPSHSGYSSPGYYGGPHMMGRTENNSPTHATSDNPCLDFFFQVVPSASPSKTASLLSSAWTQDPLTALKLAFNLRGVRGMGKADKENFYAAALWLHRQHPKTLAANVEQIARFGYMKDLLFILQRLIQGPRDPADLVRKNDKVDPKVASKLRHKKRAEYGLKVIQRYAEDPVYRSLHDEVADFFAEELLTDLENLRCGRFNKISLAAKWCPSLYSSFDDQTCIVESIARRIFPKENEPTFVKIDEEYYAYRARQRLRKDVLVPLRRLLELPEVYMSANQWGLLPYNRVASLAMKTYTPLFVKHDEERFKGYLDNVKKGKAKIAAGALLPHQILSSVYSCQNCYYTDKEYIDKSTVQVAELQWKRMVEDLTKIGKLKNCIAVCDVSGSMDGTPLDVCIALGILLSDLSEAPWKGRVITFSQYPEVHIIEGETLQEKASFVHKMQWNMNTDFQKVFDRLLEIAVRGGLNDEDMIKRVFVFSDMEFDQASSRPWETDYEAIGRKFTENGYGSCIPEIVFWNLRNSMSTPVLSKQNGVAMLSGFSKNLLKVLLKGEEDKFTPKSIMEKAISVKEYNNENFAEMPLFLKIISELPLFPKHLARCPCL